MVGLNHRVPLAADQGPLNLRLTPRTEQLVAQLRAFLRSALTQTRPGREARLDRVAVLDTGLDERLTLHRAYQFFDYSKKGRLTQDEPPSDPRGHGTKVIKLLDEILPPDVELMIGRLPASDVELTTLTVAHALGDLVARTVPDVVNMSLGTADQIVVCPSCRERVALPAFFSSMLPMVIRLAGKSTAGTVAVMAAGNEGTVANSRWIHAGLDNLVLAVAENHQGHRARYSAIPVGPTSDLYSASAFGGDDPSDADRMGVFFDATYGTSFAAPFVSAAALFAKRIPNRTVAHVPVTDLGVRVQTILNCQLSASGPRSEPGKLPGSK